MLQVSFSVPVLWLLLSLLIIFSTLVGLLSFDTSSVAVGNIACFDKLSFCGVITHDLYPKQASEKKLVNFLPVTSTQLDINVQSCPLSNKNLLNGGNVSAKRCSHNIIYWVNGRTCLIDTEFAQISTKTHHNWSSRNNTRWASARKAMLLHELILFSLVLSMPTRKRLSFSLGATGVTTNCKSW